MRGGTQNRCGEISGEFVYPESQSPQPSPAGEGGPQAGCGGDPLRDCRASTDVWGSNFRFAFYMNLGTFNRCPLHIPPLRRGPSPAGEGFFGLRPGAYEFARAFWCRQSVPPSSVSATPSQLPRRGSFSLDFQRAGRPIKTGTMPSSPCTAWGRRPAPAGRGGNSPERWSRRRRQY